jgi:thiamine-monophosphate kinase
LGEREIINLLVGTLDRTGAMAIPFGDDVAGIRLPGHRVAILKTDMLIGSSDIPPGMSLYQAARKAVVMTISDLASKGVPPTALLVAMGLPRDASREDIEAIGRGLNAGARAYGAHVIGGDTSEAPDLILAVMVYGTSSQRHLMLRGGARPGDILAVTGPFGRTGAGFKLLLEGLDAPPGLRDRLLEAIYLPRARLSEGLALRRTGVVTAAIDSSDGLAVSLHELRKMSHTGFTVTDLPMAPDAEEFARFHDLDPADLALYGGEEYELVLSVQPRGWETARRAVRRVGGSLMRIGEVTGDPSIVLQQDCGLADIPYRGWEHFRR